MQKWLMTIAVCLFSLGAFSVAPNMVLADGLIKNYTIVNGSVLMNDTKNEDMKRNWVYVKCKHWAGCYMRCIGILTACESLAKSASWEEIYLFSDKSAPKKPKKEVKK